MRSTRSPFSAAKRRILRRSSLETLPLAITASSLDEFDAEAWKAQKDEELKFLLKVRELAHEHARVAAGSRFDDDRWGRRWALGEAAYNYGTAHLIGKFSCATSYAEAARMCTDDEATELRRWFAATLEEWAGASTDNPITAADARGPGLGCVRIDLRSSTAGLASSLGSGAGRCVRAGRSWGLVARGDGGGGGGDAARREF